MLVGLADVLSVEPLFSKSQARLVMAPVDLSVKLTESGASPEVGDAENAATGGAFTTTGGEVRGETFVQSRWRAATWSPTASGDEMPTSPLPTARTFVPRHDPLT